MARVIEQTLAWLGQLQRPSAPTATRLHTAQAGLRAHESNAFYGSCTAGRPSSRAEHSDVVDAFTRIPLRGQRRLCACMHAPVFPIIPLRQDDERAPVAITAATVRVWWQWVKGGVPP